MVRVRMASGRMALGDAKSGRDVDPMLHPDSRLAFRRPRRQTHGAYRMQGIIFPDVFEVTRPGLILSRSQRAASNASGRASQHMAALDTALLSPDAFDPPWHSHHLILYP